MIGVISLITLLAIAAWFFLLEGITYDNTASLIAGSLLISIIVSIVFITVTTVVSPPPPMSSPKGWEIDTVYTIKNGKKIDVECIVKEKRINHGSKGN